MDTKRYSENGDVNHFKEAKRLISEYDKSPESSDPLLGVSYALSSIAHSLIYISQSLKQLASAGFE